MQRNGQLAGKGRPAAEGGGVREREHRRRLVIGSPVSDTSVLCVPVCLCTLIPRECVRERDRERERERERETETETERQTGRDRVSILHPPIPLYTILGDPRVQSPVFRPGPGTCTAP